MGLTILETLAVVTAGMMTGNELCVSIFDALLHRLDEREQFDLGQNQRCCLGS